QAVVGVEGDGLGRRDEAAIGFDILRRREPQGGPTALAQVEGDDRRWGCRRAAAKIDASRGGADRRDVLVGQGDRGRRERGRADARGARSQTRSRWTPSST